ncbi:MAG: riboflavin synthase [Planctomycetaceae bacterium]|nr:riboflavin synthase [Planctomycetaceae bacterium]
MFTGLIEGQGIVRELLREENGVRLTVEVPLSMSQENTSAIGDSVAINGCCLTIVEITGSCWAFQAGTETLSRTNLGELIPGSSVNLERALPADGRLGGHFVQGHVDATGTVDQILPEGEWTKIWFRIPTALSPYLVEKGSITVDGISLTVVDATTDRFSVALIPHTLSVTTLGLRKTGDRVNLETDILGKYVARMLQVLPTLQ